MTWFITTREKSGYGHAGEASCVSAEPVEKPTYTPVPDLAVQREVAGKHVILAVHGFNVSRQNGVRSLAGLERALALRPDETFFGVLWPGDWWIPVINYPSEAKDAVRSGRQLATYIDANMAAAAAVSIVSHSLGGHLLLETAKTVRRPLNELCVTAGAVDNNCLSLEYVAAKSASRRISVLSSRGDRTLRLAYPLGDFGSDVFWGDDDSPWRGALGLKGPHPVEAPPKVEHQPIPHEPRKAAYDHGHYFPPGGFGAAQTGKWTRAAAFIRRCLDGAPRSW